MVILNPIMPPRLEAGTIPNTQPFTMRENFSQMGLVEGMRDWIVTDLVPFVNENFTVLDERWVAEYNKLITDFETITVGLVSDVNGAVAEIGTAVGDAQAAQTAAEAARDQASIYASEAEAIQDVAISTIASDDASQTRTTLDGLYATAQGFADLAAEVTTGRLSVESLETMLEPLATTTNVVALVEAVRRDVSVTEHGAVGDGVTDNTAAFVAAAIAARDAGVGLNIPDGRFEVKGLVNVFSNITCQGTVLVDGASNASIKVDRLTAGVPFDYSAVGGLTAGSTRITGLGGRTGTLIITSSEILIPRVTSGTPYYTKTDSVRVLDTQGTIFPALESTYGSANIMLYEDDAALNIDGLTIEMRGTGSKSVLDLYRSNLTLNSLSITNPGGLPMSTGVRVQDASNIVFNDGTVSGFNGVSGAGYGVAIFNSSTVKFYRCEMSRCNHTITGRHMKDILISGGAYEGAIDSHWGNGMVIEDITSLCTDASNHILYCGSDLTVRRSKFYGGRNLVGIRFDTPELAGILELDTILWKPDNVVSPWMVGYSSFTDPGIDFGRTLKTPVQTTIRNVDIQYTVPYTMDLLNLTGNGYEFVRNYWANVLVESVRMVNVTTGRGFLEMKRDATHPAGSTSAVTFRNVKFPTGYTSVYIADTENSNVGQPFTLAMYDCENVRTFLPESSMSVVKYVRSLLLALTRPSVSANTWRGEYTIESCTLAATAFTGNPRYDILNSLFTGATASAPIAINTRMKSSIGNRISSTATGAPTVGKEYRNPEFYLNT